MFTNAAMIQHTQETDRKFSRVIDNMKLINIAERNLDFFTTNYNYLTWVLPIIVVAPEYFKGNVEMGVISQASSAFGHILDDLSIVVNSFTDVSKFSAGIDRLFSFLSAINALNPDVPLGSLLSLPDENVMMPKDPYGAAGVQMKVLATPASGTPSNEAILSIRSLRLATPDNKRTLLQGLDLTLASGGKLLIVGASGAGKSSLLRAIAGLWDTGAGEIRRPHPENIYFLPQRP